MKLKAAFLFGAGLIAGVILSGRPGSRPLCRTGDMTSGFSAQEIGKMETLVGGWIHNALECRIGDYLVDGPAHDGAANIFVTRHGEPSILASEKTTTLFDRHRIVYQWERSGLISYAAYDPVQLAWIENRDYGADGTVDARTSEIAGRLPKDEMRVGDRWLEIVERDGKRGTVLNGRFMSVAEARAELSANRPQAAQHAVKR